MSQVIPTQRIFLNRAAQVAALLIRDNGDSLPVCGLTSVTLLLPKADDTWLEKAAAGGMTWGYGEPLSIYTFNLIADETQLLKLGVELDSYVRIGFANTTLTFKLKNFLTVEAEPL